MIDIAANELHKYYGSNHILKGISFEIYSGERVGLLGKNGSGKTTLFKVITGEETFESGSLSKASGKIVEMLAQIPLFGENETAEDVLRSSFRETNDIYLAMKKIEDDGSASSLARYGRLMEDYERLGGYETEVKLDKVCGGMGIDSRLRESPFCLLSGGEKARVNLARILLRDCDILLLDEPTNHLDIPSLEWLEGFLREFGGTIIVISHDRVFLDRVVTRIIEIEDGAARFYNGNFSWYAQEKQRRFASLSERYERQQREIKRIEDRARWFVEQNRFTTKHHAILSRLEHMEKIEKPAKSRKLTARFEDGAYAAKEIVSFENVSKSFGSKVILDDVTLKIYRNERVALFGANGCGKTTFLRMIAGEEPCDSGSITINVSVKPAYMPQIVVFENNDATVLETFRSFTGLPDDKARSVLAGFHFMSDDARKKISALSGGEKSRLKLCLLTRNDVNFLLLDEPTNHLDIASREWIEDALTDFEGAMLFVSHDRYFLNKFADKVWSMENGVITEYDCGFDEYYDTRGPVAARREKPAQKRTARKKPEPKEKTIIKPEKRESIEKRISEAEEELKNLEAAIVSAVSASDFSRMKDMYDAKHRIEERIEALYDAWADNELSGHYE